MLFIVAMLFNIAPITYIVFGVAIVLLLVLQYDWYKKHALSEKTHIKLICCVFIIFNLLEFTSNIDNDNSSVLVVSF